MSVVNKDCFVPVHNCLRWRMELSQYVLSLVSIKVKSLYIEAKVHSPCPLQRHNLFIKRDWERLSNANYHHS